MCVRAYIVTGLGRASTAHRPGHFDKHLPGPKLMNDIRPERPQPLKQCWVRAISNSEPNNRRSDHFRHAANGEVFVLRHTASAAGTRKSPDHVIVGVPQSEVTAWRRFLTKFYEKPRQ